MTCFFNFSESKLREQAYVEFCENLKEQGVELYSIELIYDNREPFTKQGEKSFHMHTDSVLWSKENLLNILIKKLPERIEKVAGLDADIIFENPDWAVEANRKLDDTPFLQLASTFERLNKWQEVVEYRMSMARGYARNHKQFMRTPNDPYGWDTASEGKPANNYHPGYAWAASRKFLSEGGLYEYDIVGGGDISMFFCCVSENAIAISPTHAERWSDHDESHFKVFDEYNCKAYDFVRGNVGYISGNVTHIWHGDGKNSTYKPRHALTRNVDFVKDLKKDERGLLVWENRQYEESFKNLIIKQNSI